MVGAQVDDQHVVGQLRGHLAGRTVRQAEHHDVVAGERVGRGGFQDPVREATQVRLDLAEAGPGARVRGQGADLDEGVGRQEAQHLPARIAGSACDGDTDELTAGHIRHYT